MTTDQSAPVAAPSGASTGAIGLWGAFVGIMPHVLHHVLPLVGGAILTGVVGGVAFAIIGLVAMLPFLMGLRRRFGTWTAPLAATAVFAVVFAVSMLFIGPLVRGVLAGEQPSEVHPSTHQPHSSGHVP